MPRKTIKKKSVRKNQRGGRVSMPSEFFGKQSGQYNSSMIKPASLMSGFARNGMDVLSNKYGVSKIQTGGRRKNKKTKRRKSRKGGAVMGGLVKEAYKLAAPALLVAVKELVRKSKKQSGGKKKKRKSKTKKNKKKKI